MIKHDKADDFSIDRYDIFMLLTAIENIFIFLRYYFNLSKPYLIIIINFCFYLYRLDWCNKSSFHQSFHFCYLIVISYFMYLILIMNNDNDFDLKCDYNFVIFHNKYKVRKNRYRRDYLKNKKVFLRHKPTKIERNTFCCHEFFAHIYN